jgi:hypothetical protein
VLREDDARFRTIGDVQVAAVHVDVGDVLGQNFRWRPGFGVSKIYFQMQTSAYAYDTGTGGLMLFLFSSFLFFKNHFGWLVGWLHLTPGAEPTKDRRSLPRSMGRTLCLLRIPAEHGAC